MYKKYKFFKYKFHTVACFYSTLQNITVYNYYRSYKMPSVTKRLVLKNVYCYNVSMLHTGILRNIKHLQPMDSNFQWSQGYSKYGIMVAVGSLGRWCH